MLRIRSRLRVIDHCRCFALGRANKDDRHARQQDQNRSPQAELRNATGNSHCIFSKTLKQLPLRLDYIPASVGGKRKLPLQASINLTLMREWGGSDNRLGIRL